MPIRTELKGPVARITIVNPPMNQIDPETHADFLASLGRLASEPTVRALVLTGEGGRAFSAGADIKGLASRQSPEALDAFAAALDELYRRIREFPHPVIAAVNGYAMGVGFEIVLSTEIRIAAQHAKMGATAANLGLVTSIFSLATQLPPSLAKELFYTARHVDAEEAFRIGLVNRVVPADELDAAVDETVEQILRRAPLSLKMAKELMHNALQSERDQHDLVHRRAFVSLLQTEDHHEGVQAFLERRTPRFTGR